MKYSILTQSINQTRRSTLKAIAALPFCSYGLSALQTASAETCTLPPSMAKGPYWVDDRLNRADVTTDTDRASVINGLPLILNLQFFNDGGCGTDPVSNMQIDIWHTDAAGEYSDVSGSGQSNTIGQKFLRGYQFTDAEGKVSFRTIYPGWYPGRTAHIHLRARAYNENGNSIYDFATQIFFDDEITDTVYAQEPYNTRGTRRTRNSNDSGFLSVRNNPPMLNLSTNDDGSMTGEMTISLSNVPNNIVKDDRFDVVSINNGSETIPSISSVLTVNPTDVGAMGNIYVLAFLNGAWFINNGQTWSTYNSTVELAAFYTGRLGNLHRLTVLSGLEVSTIKGTQLYVGYGLNSQDMLQKSQYKIAYVL